MGRRMGERFTRRHFLRGSAASGLALATAPLTVWSQVGAARGGRYDRLLILIELKGGNDGLNTVVPYADPRYASLRPRLAIPADQVQRLDSATGLHPALAPLMPLWQTQELAVLQSVGYADPNLSHFRSIEIWETASGSHEYLPDGWLARVFRHAPAPAAFAADAVIIGGGEMGPFAGGARAVALNDTERFSRDAIRVQPHEATSRGALGHLLKVEREVAQAGNRLGGNRSFRTAFPPGAFGNAIRTAAQVIAGPHGVAAIRVSLNGFDTHRVQPAVHANLLKNLGEGMVALRNVLIELGRWDSTLVMTYSEFGRRAAENRSQGTDHGTASVHFAMGGRVRGGLHGLPPALDRLDTNGNIPYAIDFKDLYGTILADWWDLDPAIALGGKRQALPLLKV